MSHENKTKRDEIIELSKSGLSNKEIASKCGLSRQRVTTILNENGCAKLTCFQKERIKSIKFKKIMEFLESKKLPVSTFLLLCGVHTGKNSNISNFLFGNAKRVDLEDINKILDFMGMTYEEVFR